MAERQDYDVNAKDSLDSNDDWIRLFLVRLKKLQVSESLDRLAADNRSHVSLLVPGISKRQIAMTKHWVMHELLGSLELAVEERKKDEAGKEDAKGHWEATWKDGEPHTQPAETEFSVAVPPDEPAKPPEVP